MMKTSHPQLGLASALLLALPLLLALASCGGHRVQRAAPEAARVYSPEWPSAGAYPFRLTGRKVLLVGDSMGQGIAPFLQRKVEEAGGSFVGAPEQSSTIIWWQGSGKLRALISKHRPDVIFIALGSNELYVKDAEGRAAVIRSMVAEIGERDAYWIGPPVWKPGSKLLPVIEENFQAGRVYNSEGLDVPRGKDGKHPTLEGYERWAELIWTWYARGL